MGWRCPTGAATAAALVLGSVVSPPGPYAIAGAAAIGAAALLLRRRLRRGAPALAASLAAITALGAGAGAIRVSGPRPAPLDYRPEVTVAGAVAGWETRRDGVVVTVRAYRIGARRPDPPVSISLFGALAWGDVPAAGWVRFRGRLVPTRNATVPGGWVDRESAGRLVPAGGTGPEWGPGPPPRMLIRRAALTRRVRTALRGFPARLAEAMLLGRGSALSPEERAVFRRCGASHLVAVSGLHVGLLAGLVALFLAGAPPWLRGGAAVLAGWGYAAVAGWSPSAVRAATLVTLVTAGSLARRPRPAPAWLALALPWLVWAAPALIGSVSFRLSVGAVGGILLALEIARPPAGLRGGIAGPVAAGLGAQWGTLPAALSAFGTLSPLALVPNLAAIPLAGLFLPAVLLALATAGAPGAGAIARDAAMALGAAIGGVLGSRLPSPALRERVAAPGGVGGGVLGPGAAGMVRKPGRVAAPSGVAMGGVPGRGGGGRVLSPLPAGGAGAVGRVPGRGAGGRRGVPVCRGLGVGGGRRGRPGPRGRGAKRGVAVPASRRRPPGGRAHPLPPPPGSRGGVGIVSGRDAGGPDLRRGLRRAGGNAGRVDSVLAAHRAAACLVAAGDTLYRAGGAVIVAVHPPRGNPVGPVPGGDLNEVSLMVRVVEGSFSVLFAGDGGSPAETACLARGEPLRARVLKVGHHGSRWASSPEFLECRPPGHRGHIVRGGEPLRTSLPGGALPTRRRPRAHPSHRPGRDGDRSGGGPGRARGLPPSAPVPMTVR